MYIIVATENKLYDQYNNNEPLDYSPVLPLHYNNNNDYNIREDNNNNKNNNRILTSLSDLAGSGNCYYCHSCCFRYYDYY